MAHSFVFDMKMYTKHTLIGFLFRGVFFSEGHIWPMDVWEPLYYEKYFLNQMD
jgi:hypothetical protein